jgi:hypothetical protein
MTTIQITQELQNELMSRKITSSETYEEVIWDLVEDTEELSAETMKEIEEARKQVGKGEFYTLEQVKKELGD